MNFHYKEPSFRMVLLVSTSVDRRLMKSSKVQFGLVTAFVRYYLSVFVAFSDLYGIHPTFADKVLRLSYRPSNLHTHDLYDFET